MPRRNGSFLFLRSPQCLPLSTSFRNSALWFVSLPGYVLCFSRPLWLSVITTRFPPLGISLQLYFASCLFLTFVYWSSLSVLLYQLGLCPFPCGSSRCFHITCFSIAWSLLSLTCFPFLFFFLSCCSAFFVTLLHLFCSHRFPPCQPPPCSDHHNFSLDTTAASASGPSPRRNQ
jgi:hypothetical protein